MIPTNNPRSRVFRLLIAIAGIAFLLISNFQNPLKIEHLNSVFILSLFIAAQLVFPIGLSAAEISLIHVSILGGGLLFGLSTAGWAALIGIFGGLFLRQQLLIKFGSTNRHTTYPMLLAGSLVGLNVISLAVGLITLNLESGYFLHGSNLTPSWPTSLAICLAFAVLHTTLFLSDLGISEKGRIALSRPKSLTLFLIEFLPLPFIILLVVAYPVIKVGSTTLLGVLPLVIGVLLNRINLAHGELNRRMRDLSTVNQISRMLRSTLEMEKLLGTIHRQVTNLLSVDNFYVALFDAEEELIWYPLAVKHSLRQDWPRRPLTNRLTDRVIQEGKPLLLGHHAGKTLANIGLPSGEDAPYAWMGVPLITSERTIGCLALFSLSEEIEFTQEDIDLLTILSGQASVAIENALLYKRVEQRAVQLESLVHDLRSPISAVVSAIDVIQDSTLIPEEDDLSNQALRIARRSAQRVLSMVESLLDIAKFQTNDLVLELTPVDLKSLVAQTVEDFMMQANEFGILLKDEVSSDLPPVMADKDKIKRVITNLVDNAVKYSPSGGQIVIAANPIEKDKIKLQVIDTGPGIPEEYRQRIFERFTQIPGQEGRRRGYGLGLTYCRLAVEAHKGRIWVEPRPGGGSIFAFTLTTAEMDNFQT